MSQATLPGDINAEMSKAPLAFGLETSFIQSQEAGFPALSADDSASCSSSESARLVSSTELRAMLASSMSTMYRQEVPLYGTLLSIISEVNSDVLIQQERHVSEAEERRISVERHGAIRVGTALELHTLARIFAVFGMSAVGYYDLYKDAGLPIHATAFRAVDGNALERNPFRIFCSLLRMELIQDESVRSLASDLLSRRNIFSKRCLELLSHIESSSVQDSLARSTALEFVDEVVDIFRWHPSTPVSLAEYQKLHAVHPLVADIVSFRGPHINHLTPRTLDIDRVQQVMVERGIDAKEVVEGPPARKNPIYLRQTSFHALSEQVTFEGDSVSVQGRHKARFGEIEARGQALTRKGAQLYDQLMAQVTRTKATTGNDYERILSSVFSHGFPDDLETIRTQGLGYFVYSVENAALARGKTAETASAMLTMLLQTGAVRAEPLTYEDFLPASAAGIFQSNLPPGAKQAETSPRIKGQAQSELESAIGTKVLDYFELYQAQQDASLRQVGRELGCHVLLS